MVPECVAALLMFAELVVEDAPAEAPQAMDATARVEIAVVDVAIRTSAECTS